MKIIVKEQFTDKFDHKTIYKVGKKLDFDEERCQDLIKRGLAELAEEKLVVDEPIIVDNEGVIDGDKLSNDEVIEVDAPEVIIENTELAEEPVKVEKPKRNNKKK